MLTIDTRCLQESFPTGVSVVAGQFITHLRAAFPHAHELTTKKSFSNTLTNVRLAFGLATIEKKSESRNVVFLPNVHFVNTHQKTMRIQVAHDLSFFHAPQWYAPRMRAWHMLARATEQLQTADHVIAVSEWTARGLTEFLHIPASRVHLVNPHTPVSEAPSRPEALPFPHDAPFFLFLGTLEKRKNVSSVVEAFDLIKNEPHFKNFHLALVGRAGYGTPRARAMSERVHHIPYVTAAEKSWFLHAARALVYPSFFEGFGLPPLEAAAAGCPSIISDCTAPQETMGDSALQVSPYDVKQIAHAMHELGTNELLRTEIISRGRARSAWYSVERQREQLEPIMQIISAHI